MTDYAATVRSDLEPRPCLECGVIGACSECTREFREDMIKWMTELREGMLDFYTKRWEHRDYRESAFWRTIDGRIKAKMKEMGR